MLFSSNFRAHFYCPILKCEHDTLISLAHKFLPYVKGYREKSVILELKKNIKKLFFFEDSCYWHFMRVGGFALWKWFAFFPFELIDICRISLFYSFMASNRKSIKQQSEFYAVFARHFGRALIVFQNMRVFVHPLHQIHKTMNKILLS